MRDTTPKSQQILIWGLAAYAASTLVSMAVMSIGIGVLLASLLLALGGVAAFGREVRTTAQAPWMKRYLALSLALVAACAVSLIAALLAPVGWGGEVVHPQFWNDLAKVWYFVWPLVLVIALKRVGVAGRQTVVRVWLGMFALVSFIGIVQYFTGWPRPQAIPGNLGRFHATMFLGHHLSVASILIFPFFACLDFLKKPSPVRMRVPVLALFSLAGFAALFLTYSRMLWLALPVGVLIWAVRALPRKQAGVAVACIAIALVASSQVPEIRRRVVDAIGTEDRWKLWSANIEFLKQRPLTGVGFRRNIEASNIYLNHQPNNGWIFTGHAHNNVLDVLGSTGSLGLIAWLAWCLFAFVILRHVLKRSGSERTFAWGLVCAWIVFQLNGLTQVNFWEGKVMHQMMWAMAWALLWADEAELTS